MPRKTIDSAKKKAAELKDEAVKKATEVKDEATKKATEVKDEATKKAAKVKDTATKKAVEVKDEAAKKANETGKAAKAATKKAATKATEAVTEVYVQYDGMEISEYAMVERIKGAYQAAGNKTSNIKSLQIYVKPQENAAYYVINNTESGKIHLF